MLVNNAGSMFVMPLLDTDIGEAKKMYDVNVWGLLSVTQGFAGMLVRSKGVVLNIASIAGAVRMAWQGEFSPFSPPPIPPHPLYPLSTPLTPHHYTSRSKIADI